MSTTLKQEFIERISANENENLLQLMREGFDYFKGVGKPDIEDELSEENSEELKIF